MTMFDAIVVGCGPVGAVAAHLLGARGISTLVVERELRPYDLPRAIHIDAEIMRILQSANLAEHLLPSLFVPTASVQVGVDGGVIRRLAKGGHAHRMGWSSNYMFYQPELEALLRSRFHERPTLQVRLGCALDTVRQDAEGVTATVTAQDGRSREVRARYMLACDGAASRVRKELQIGLEDLQFEEPWLVIDADVEGPVTVPPEIGAPANLDLSQVSLMVCQPRRPSTAIPGRGRHRRWEFMLLPGETDEEMRQPERIQALLAPWVSSARCQVLRAAVYRFHGLIARRWQEGRVFLVGDAAHQTPPFYGQGLCHGIRDAANLAWKLQLVLQGRAGPELLQSYEPERKPQVRAAIEASVAAGRYICTLDLEAARQRDARMRAAMQEMTGESYFKVAPLSAGVLRVPAANGVGSAFIQPRVRTEDGRDRLLDDATGGGFVLLCRRPALLRGIDADLGNFWGELRGVTALFDHPNAPDSQQAGVLRLADETGEITRWLDDHGADAVILRPDAYVFAVIGAEQSIEESLRALRSALSWRDDEAFAPAVQAHSMTRSAT